MPVLCPDKAKKSHSCCFEHVMIGKHVFNSVNHIWFIFELTDLRKIQKVKLSPMLLEGPFKKLFYVFEIFNDITAICYGYHTYGKIALYCLKRDC
mmetsp:Transcript_142949/g.259956  ORF Transcript_142949/g.259956 Transcript_142949/m.259956 type:complete len:95 (+) Transcript_142949:427-711(+)